MPLTTNNGMPIRARRGESPDAPSFEHSREEIVAVLQRTARRVLPRRRAIMSALDSFASNPIRTRRGSLSKYEFRQAMQKSDAGLSFRDVGVLMLLLNNGTDARIPLDRLDRLLDQLAATDGTLDGILHQLPLLAPMGRSTMTPPPPHPRHPSPTSKHAHHHQAHAHGHRLLATAPGATPAASPSQPHQRDPFGASHAASPGMTSQQQQWSHHHDPQQQQQAPQEPHHQTSVSSVSSTVSSRTSLPGGRALDYVSSAAVEGRRRQGGRDAGPTTGDADGSQRPRAATWSPSPLPALSWGEEALLRRWGSLEVNRPMASEGSAYYSHQVANEPALYPPQGGSVSSASAAGYPNDLGSNFAEENVAAFGGNDEGGGGSGGFAGGGLGVAYSGGGPALTGPTDSVGQGPRSSTAGGLSSSSWVGMPMTPGQARPQASPSQGKGDTLDGPEGSSQSFDRLLRLAKGVTLTACGARGAGQQQGGGGLASQGALAGQPSDTWQAEGGGVAGGGAVGPWVEGDDGRAGLFGAGTSAGGHGQGAASFTTARLVYGSQAKGPGPGAGRAGAQGAKKGPGGSRPSSSSAAQWEDIQSLQRRTLVERQARLRAEEEILRLEAQLVYGTGAPGGGAVATGATSASSATSRLSLDAGESPGGREPLRGTDAGLLRGLGQSSSAERRGQDVASASSRTRDSGTITEPEEGWVGRGHGDRGDHGHESDTNGSYSDRYHRRASKDAEDEGEGGDSPHRYHGGGNFSEDEDYGTGLDAWGRKEAAEAAGPRTAGHRAQPSLAGDGDLAETSLRSAQGNGDWDGRGRMGGRSRGPSAPANGDGDGDVYELLATVTLRAEVAESRVRQLEEEVAVLRRAAAGGVPQGAAATPTTGQGAEIHGNRTTAATHVVAAGLASSTLFHGGASSVATTDVKGHGDGGASSPAHNGGWVPGQVETWEEWLRGLRRAYQARVEALPGGAPGDASGLASQVGGGNGRAGEVQGDGVPAWPSKDGFLVAERDKGMDELNLGVAGNATAGVVPAGPSMLEALQALRQELAAQLGSRN
eukprot:jgi/Mesvir1/19913/Mv13184-RA.1